MTGEILAVTLPSSVIIGARSLEQFTKNGGTLTLTIKAPAPAAAPATTFPTEPQPRKSGLVRDDHNPRAQEVLQGIGDRLREAYGDKNTEPGEAGHGNAH